ncbi:MAG: amino acid permease, partial [Lysobacteraceae bacterium]
MDRPDEDLLASAGDGAGPRRLLGVRQAIALIVGVVIGAGIFKSPAIVAGLSGSADWMFAMWILGGLISLVGALCYSELTTAYPHPGGDYHFLHRAYGRSTAFLFGWARFAVITTGSIALLAFVFGDYMQQALPLTILPDGWGAVAYACSVIVVLSLVNLRGLRTGAGTQMWLTLAEIGGLLLLSLAAAFFTDPAPAAAQAQAAAPLSFGMAMVFVLLTYGGWNEAAYISAEVRGGAAGMVRALTFSILIITTLYLMVTWACLETLGMQGMARSE